MKFKKLTITNIGSIENKTIDFTANPLGSASLFLISGPTGSGKSIILDSICLALYGKAVRLEKVSNRESYLDPEFNCTADGSISLSDSRQLVRRGTTNACASLVFDGNDGNEYTASWIATRGKKQKLSTMLTAGRRITATNGSVDYNKEADCNSFIASPNIVGLKFDEFCRTTLLAQGEFTKFLDSDTKEKANILEKVTGTEKFSKIGEMINIKFKEIQESAKDLLRDINDPEKQPMTDEERKALVSEDTDLVGARKEAVSAKELAAAKKSLLDRQHANTLKDAQADERLKQAIAQKATTGYKEAIKTSSDWKASLEARSALATRSKAKRDMDAAMSRRNELCKKYESLAGNLIWLEESLGAFKDLDAEIEDAKKKLEDAKKEHAKLNPEVLADEGKKLNSEKIILEQIFKQAQVWLSDKRCIIKQDILDLFSSEHDSLYKQALTASEALWEAEKNQTEAQNKYNEVFSGFQNHAAAVRATLKEGDTCPICGNVVKQLLSDETITGILKPYKDDIETAKQACEGAKKACNDVIDSITEKSNGKNQEIKVWQDKNAKVTASANQVMAFTTQLATLNGRAATKTAIAETIRRIADVKARSKQALAAEEPANPIKAENKKLESQWVDFNSEISTNSAEHRAAKDNWDKAQEAITTFLAANPTFSEEYLIKLSEKSMNDINELDRKVKQVDDIETTAVAQKDACKAENEAIASEIREKGYVFGEEETSEILGEIITKEEEIISGIDTRRGAIENALKADDNKIKSMEDTRKDYEKIRPTLTNYETLNSLFGQGGGTLFKKIAQSHLLGVLLENANFYLGQFTDRYELMRQEGSLVVLMKDKQQDEAPRPANTLSGGESFMASLALALGLSSFNSSDFSSDTIFIDEGFGTLSPNCLTNVYETLSSLKKVVGKKVGIISHVEELKEQIHPQIVVEPLGNGLSRINDPA